MGKLNLLEEAESKNHEIVLKLKDFNSKFDDDVEIVIRPKTRALIMLCSQIAKTSPLARRHTEIINGEKVVVDGNEADAFVRTLAKKLILRGSGILLRGEPVDLSGDEEKEILFNIVGLANWIVDQAEEQAIVSAEIDEKN